MRKDKLEEILTAIKAGKLDVDEAVRELRHLPFRDLGFANVDSHRELRQGFPEVIFGEGKDAGKIAAIAKEMINSGHNVLITRLDEEKARHISGEIDGAEYVSDAGVMKIIKGEIKVEGKGDILVVSAGTSDIPVAEEAFHTADMMGNRVERLYDVGVAGIHRLLSRHEKLAGASVIIAVAGMEGALPSVVGGLVSCPVIAVPTSVGYGASFNGVTALLAMLNSCASGVTVVNIDNGFGAAYAASLINRV
ncbi:MAG: nickel pincer cofactor biosynthesis protein LarB [Deltaproteobacteria bacterium]|nr:nickel pincer cofactor biosynthesis protein LarB [Deltaproteobacteria bacterium]